MAQKQILIKQKLASSAIKREMALKKTRDTIEEKIKLGAIKSEEIKKQKEREVSIKRQKAKEKQEQLELIKLSA